MDHPSGIPQKIVDKVVRRRGRLHAFETIDARKTALVVIDLDSATVKNDDQCSRMTPTVNSLADAVRNNGGVVAWVLSSMPVLPPNFVAILGDETANRYFNDGQLDGPGTKLWHELRRHENDLLVIKS